MYYDDDFFFTYFFSSNSHTMIISLQPLARLGAKVTGIDAVAGNIIAADAHAKIDANVAENVEYMCSTVEDMVDDYRGSFDAVIASEVIEHVNNQPHFIKSCSELIKVLLQSFPICPDLSYPNHICQC